MNSKTETYYLGIFVVLSVLLHIAACVALYYFAPEAEMAVEGPYIVRLVPLEPAPALQAPEKEAPPPPKRRASVKRKAPPEPEPPPKEFSSLPSSQNAPKRPLSGAEVKSQAEDTAQATSSGKKEEAASEAPGFSSPSQEREGLGEEKLFDRDVLASAIEKGKEPKPPESSVTFDTKEIRHWGYMQRLKERIEYVWEYPQEAAAKGIYGDLVIRFVIKEDGSLGAVELMRTSGWKDLDRAAIQALRDGAPYWPLPEEWGTSSLTVTGHFIYTTHGYYYVR